MNQNISSHLSFELIVIGHSTFELLSLGLMSRGPKCGHLSAIHSPTLHNIFQGLRHLVSWFQTYSHPLVARKLRLTKYNANSFCFRMQLQGSNCSRTLYPTLLTISAQIYTILIYGILISHFKIFQPIRVFKTQQRGKFYAINCLHKIGPGLHGLPMAWSLRSLGNSSTLSQSEMKIVGSFFKISANLGLFLFPIFVMFTNQ